MTPHPDIVVAALLQPSRLCKALIQHWEECRLEAYMPTPNDRPTIGWGMTRWKGRPVRMGMRITQEEADNEFALELAQFAAAVRRIAPSFPTTSRNQFDAMVSLAYNIGVSAFEKSTLVKLHRSRLYPDAADEFLKWNKQAGKALRGLARRRVMEMHLYETPIGQWPLWASEKPSGAILIKEPSL